jgi:alpha-glucosidase (family GH31 glycosyl hydrolase)
LLPVFVKAGAILPRQAYATSTARSDKTRLLLDVYPGASGRAVLHEDDDVSEEFRKHGRIMSTTITWNDAARTLDIAPARGSYNQAPTRRAYQITLHDAGRSACFSVNGKSVHAILDPVARTATLHVPLISVRKMVNIRPCV